MCLKTAILNMSNSQKWSYQCINQMKSIENIFFHNDWSFEEGSLARERRTKRPRVHLGLICSLNSCPKPTQTIKNHDHFSEQPCSKSRTKRTWVHLGLIGPTNFCLLSIIIKSFEQAVISQNLILSILIKINWRVSKVIYKLKTEIRLIE